MGATSASKSRTHVQSETLSIIERKSLPEYAAYIIVRMDAGGLDIPSGKLFNAFLQKPVSFTGLSDMLLKMDQIYDFLDFPQATGRTGPSPGKNSRSMTGSPRISHVILSAARRTYTVERGSHWLFRRAIGKMAVGRALSAALSWAKRPTMSAPCNF